ncbi:MAG: DNA primase family protein [bacterium]
MIKLINKKIQQLKDKKSLFFAPLKLAKITLEYEKTQGREWMYSEYKDLFYLYRNGVWKIEDSASNGNPPFQLELSVVKILEKITPAWNQKSKINDIVRNIKYIKNDKQNLFLAENQTKKYVNVKNGMLDWKTNNLIPHDAGYQSIFQINSKFDSKASCPYWKNILKEWVPDEDSRLFLQQFIGYLLIPDTSGQKYLILYGTGSNGKSAFIDTIIRLLNQTNVSSLDLHQFDGDEGRFSAITIENKLANISADIDFSYFKKTGKLKKIISGDMITSDRKHKKSYKFKPITSFMFATNKLPKSKDTSRAWYRRFEIIEFPNHFKNDHNKIGEISTNIEKELSGILNWALEGLRLYKKHGWLISNKMKSLKNEYIRYNNPIKAFIDDEIIITKNMDDDLIPTGHVYEKYKEWCKANCFEVESIHKLSRTFTSQGVVSSPERIGGSTHRHYHGIKLK